MNSPRRDNPGVLAPPPLIFLGFLLIGWGIGHLANEPSMGLATNVRRGLAFAFVIAGLVTEMTALGGFRRVGTSPEPWKPTTALVTGGLYRFSRNPIYIGFTLIYVGFAFAMDSWAALALLLPCLVVIDRAVVLREEAYLAGKFGAEWDAYASKVRRWL